MGIYSVRESYIGSDYLEDVEVEDIFEESFDEAALRHTYEIDSNLNNIMKAIGISELAVLEETGEEMVYEAGTISSLFEKLKAAVKKIWEKIKSLFTKFFAKMQSFGKDDKAFVNKYRKEIMAGSTKDLEIKGYKFTLDAIKGADAILEDMKKVKIPGKKPGMNGRNVESAFNMTTTIASGMAPAEFDIDDADLIENIRGAALGSTNSYDAGEFSKELRSKLRGDEDSPITLDDSDIDKGEIVQFLMNSSSGSSDIKKDFKSVKKTCEDQIKELDRCSKNLSKIEKPADKDKVNEDSKKLTQIAKYNTIATNCLTILEQIEAAKMTAFNDKRKQYKATCVKLIGRKAKNESYGYNDYYDEDAISSLDNLRLI